MLQEQRDAQLGTEVPFSINEKRYIARIERHYHPEGGPIRPWGYHKGVSLLVLESPSS